jgi:5-methylcytosine-specific restriction endonuclease McrA
MRFHDVLILNKGWVPVHIVEYKKVISILYQEQGHALDRDYIAYNFKDWLHFSEHNADDFQKLHSPSITLALPEIVVLTKYDRLPQRDVKYSRENVFMRDKYKCQYCGEKFPYKELTIDHVIPKSLGGKSLWSNVVACCKQCNGAKADRRLEQCGMKLIHKPVSPRWFNPLMRYGSDHVCKSWKRFMERIETNIIEGM